MALYMVKASPKKELLENLQKDLIAGKTSKMRPFGQALQYSLENARIDNQNPDYAVWVEEDYCCIKYRIKTTIFYAMQVLVLLMATTIAIWR
jgi:hypothetical protein